VGKAQGGIACNATFALNDLSASIGRHNEVPRQLGGQNPDGGQFGGQDLSWKCR
jgi:hypothetical protein